ncbi:hypothetical protein KAZ82_02495, partial [Candidatus Babeliales bacterium]|nr:hypothetical protein [Candidatus Babeliales bacterium]
WYTDEFGATQSNYSMGNFVECTITPGTVVPVDPVSTKYQNKAAGLNLYYNIAEIPYAHDAFTCIHNADNLYNFIGNLYAGYAALHHLPSEFVLGKSGTKFEESPWMTVFRQPNQWQSGSLGFDNNPSGVATLYLKNVSQDPGYIPVAKMYDNSISIDQGRFLVGGIPNHFYTLKRANASCAWSSKIQSGNFILSLTSSSYGYYAAPYGQFWGARLSHILGAVTNDIPVSKAAAISSTWMAMPAGTPTPPVAIFSGGPAAVAGSTVPSTAHFGSLMNFVNYWLNNKVTPAIKNSTYYAYIKNHLLPTLQRFAAGGPSAVPLCSYQLTPTATGANLIEINDANVTSYDNGVIVDIENNTGRDLYIKQCVKGSGDNQIGILKPGSNNYFLNTASLMQSIANNTATGQPPLGNLIECKDLVDNVSAYVQVMNPTQLQTLITNLNSALNNFSSSSSSANSSTNNFVYNQNTNNQYQQPTSNEAAYLVVTNFDSNNITQLQGNNLIMARVQALDIGEFQGQPYFATIKIDKEQIGYGLNNGVLMQGVSDSSILYPSILSVKTFSWLNPYAQTQGQSYYSQMPLLLLPELIDKSGIAGLHANYGIWLMSYAAALTEFQFNCAFGDTMDCLNNTFKIFSIDNQSAPARVVIDANNVLQSGQIMTVLPTVSDQQSNATYLTLMGSDVWDCGQNFHQDIPVLNLYADAAGNPVANQQGAAYTNLLVTFEVEKITHMQVHNLTSMAEKSVNAIATVAKVERIEDVEVSTKVDSFADGYGQPYNNIMLFSIPTERLKQGVRLEWMEYQPGCYQITVRDETQAHNVLAVQVVSIAAMGDILQVTVNFINRNDAQWGSFVTLPESMTAAPLKQTRSCVLKYSNTDGQNNLFIVPGSALVHKKVKKSRYGYPVIATVHPDDKAIHAKDVASMKAGKKKTDKKTKPKEKNPSIVDKRAKKPVKNNVAL